ncbi:lytic transglycosylase domain-containing protein [Aureimonas sp. AU20]|uniref:lytic transglycosylase domain-containing protein n=1 Tax=Aureimonas sp. AU20 TaxID=1349819 RepID=UPI0007202B43|nr:lytic transglycosylase domain-containing protein [Aureimonas sp. AU20]ALN75186.1 hypothetical protein M673_20855 [Aureimonas sp. AU20]
MVRAKTLRPLLLLCLLLAGGGRALAAGEGEETKRSVSFAEATCRIIEDEAARNGLPASFFARLIWRESLFNPKVISPKGAQGIAQFMPGTAAERGLADPFDVPTALAHSAQYLTELKAKMGSLGLAAAAYNAGPNRVAAWKQGKSALPLETQDYVHWITGHSAEDWSAATKALPLLPIAEKMPFATACRKLAARGLTARMPDGTLKPSGWQALLISGLGIQQVKASRQGRIRVVIDTEAPARRAGAASRPK